MPHRPLSEWVTVLPLSADGTAVWSARGPINFGDERADARGLAQLAAGWQRRAVPLDLGYHALALVRDAAEAAAIELDDLARPVRVTISGSQLIARIEDGWPAADVPPAESSALAREDVTVRYVLLARLAAEGEPPPGLFHILPWDLVEQLAVDVGAALVGEPAPEHVTQLRHWFTPVGSRFTASLEQLDEGLRRQDPAMSRAAATALCTRVLSTHVARLPASTRLALARLVSRLREQNPFLGFTAARAARLLTGTGEGDPQQPGALRADSQLAPAADTSTGIRRETRTAARDPFTLELTITATGQAEIRIEAPLGPGQDTWLAAAYGVMIQPVTVTGAGPATRYLIPLGLAGTGVAGGLSLPISPGRLVTVDLDGSPIGAAEARSLAPAEVERSIRSLRTRHARQRWVQLAAMLPAGHPLRAVITREAE